MIPFFRKKRPLSEAIFMMIAFALIGAALLSLFGCAAVRQCPIERPFCFVN